MLTVEVEIGSCRYRRRNKGKLSSPRTGSRLDPEHTEFCLGRLRDTFSTECGKWREGITTDRNKDVGLAAGVENALLLASSETISPWPWSTGVKHVGGL